MQEWEKQIFREAFSKFWGLQKVLKGAIKGTTKANEQDVVSTISQKTGFNTAYILKHKHEISEL